MWLYGLVNRLVNQERTSLYCALLIFGVLWFAAPLFNFFYPLYWIPYALVFFILLFGAAAGAMRRSRWSLTGTAACVLLLLFLPYVTSSLVVAGIGAVVAAIGLVLRSHGAKTQLAHLTLFGNVATFMGGFLLLGFALIWAYIKGLGTLYRTLDESNTGSSIKDKLVSFLSYGEPQHGPDLIAQSLIFGAGFLFVTGVVIYIARKQWSFAWISTISLAAALMLLWYMRFLATWSISPY